MALLMLTIALAACGVSSVDDGSAPGALASDSVAARQQLAAARQAAEVVAQRIAAATANAMATDRARAYAATATEQAFTLAVRRAQATSTADAQHAAATQTAQAINSTATVSALALASTREAQQAQSTQQAAAAQATADARDVQTSLERQAATATAQAVQLNIAQAVRDAERVRGDADFYNLVWRIVVVIASVAILFGFIWFGYKLTAEFLMTQFMRRTVMETRMGTMIFIGTPRDGYTPTLLAPPSQTTVIDHDAPTQAHVAQTVNVSTNTGRKYQMGTSADPTDTERQLVMRLLREAAKLNGWQSNVIPSAKDLCWSSDTRGRAVNLIRPYIDTKQGRPSKAASGGTLIGERHGTLHNLYGEVGARRVALSPLAPSNGRTS